MLWIIMRFKEGARMLRLSRYLWDKSQRACRAMSVWAMENHSMFLGRVLWDQS